MPQLTDHGVGEVADRSCRAHRPVDADEHVEVAASRLALNDEVRRRWPEAGCLDGERDRERSQDRGEDPGGVPWPLRPSMIPTVAPITIQAAAMTMMVTRFSLPGV